MLIDIATEELSHLEVIGTVVGMLDKGAKGRITEGYLVAVGYMDPGNWATGLAGGSAYGYALLWVIVLSSTMAMLLQTLIVSQAVLSLRLPFALIP